MEKLPFIPGQIIRRRDIHTLYGGNWQSGICPSRTFPYIFIFSGKKGKEHGYKDDWDNPNVYSYTGEGQIGDMRYAKGNLALRDHVKNGKRVFLFEQTTNAFVKFITELVVFDSDYEEIPDSNKNLRKGIRFFFHRVGVTIPKAYNLFTQPSIAADNIFNYKHKKPNITERKGLVTSRVGQGAYRKDIIHRWEYKCAVTGFDNPKILIASHIIPWKGSTDSERLDVNNGILLSPVYDALFDKHFISFENSGKILLSDSIVEAAYKKIGVTGNEVIKLLNSDNNIYLEKHRSQFK